MNIHENQYLDNELLEIANDIEDSNAIEFLEKMLLNILTNFTKDKNLNSIEALKALRLVNFFCEKHKFEKLNLQELSIDSYSSDFRNIIVEYLDDLIINHTNLYDNPFMQSIYKLTDEETTTIQDLINNLREKIQKEQNITEEHKERILKKLNDMQKEFDKKISTFDNILGKSMDILKVLKYARKEIASPLIQDTTKLIKEINKIESKYSGLPDIENQIDYKECIKEVEIIETKQIGV